MAISCFAAFASPFSFLRFCPTVRISHYFRVVVLGIAGSTISTNALAVIIKRMLGVIALCRFTLCSVIAYGLVPVITTVKAPVLGKLVLVGLGHLVSTDTYAL